MSVELERVDEPSDWHDDRVIHLLHNGQPASDGWPVSELLRAAVIIQAIL